MGEDPGTIREDIEQTRERMGETVDALAYKTDVKSRAKDSVSTKVDAVKTKVTGTAGSVSEATPSTPKLDVVVANYVSNTVSVLLGNGNGSLGPSNMFSTASSPFSVAIADLNADGKPDLAVADSEQSGSVAILLNRLVR